MPSTRPTISRIASSIASCRLRCLRPRPGRRWWPLVLVYPTLSQTLRRMAAPMAAGRVLEGSESVAYFWALNRYPASGTVANEHKSVCRHGDRMLTRGDHHCLVPVARLHQSMPASADSRAPERRAGRNFPTAIRRFYLQDASRRRKSMPILALADRARLLEPLSQVPFRDRRA
jgi:hypothetical protein